MDKKWIIAIVVGILVVFGSGFFFLQDRDGSRNEDKGASLDNVVSPNSDNSTTKEGVEGSGDFSVTSGDPLPGTTNILPPSLNRKIEVTDMSLPKESATIALKRIPELVAILNKNTSDVDSWLELALYRTLIGDYRGAEEVYVYLYKTRPKNIVVISNLANLYARNIKDYPKAEQYFTESINLEHKNVALYQDFYEFYRYIYTAKSDLADNILLKGIGEMPENTQLLVSLARYYRDTGNISEARVYYERAAISAQKNGNIKVEDAIRAEIKEL